MEDLILNLPSKRQQGGRKLNNRLFIMVLIILICTFAITGCDMSDCLFGNDKDDTKLSYGYGATWEPQNTYIPGETVFIDESVSYFQGAYESDISIFDINNVTLTFYFGNRFYSTDSIYKSESYSIYFQHENGKSYLVKTVNEDLTDEKYAIGELSYNGYSHNEKIRIPSEFFTENSGVIFFRIKCLYSCSESIGAKLGDITLPIRYSMEGGKVHLSSDLHLNNIPSDNIDGYSVDKIIKDTHPDSASVLIEKNKYDIDNITLDFLFGRYFFASAESQRENGSNIQNAELYFEHEDGERCLIKVCEGDYISEEYRTKWIFNSETGATGITYNHKETIKVPPEMIKDDFGLIYFSVYGTDLNKNEQSKERLSYATIYYLVQGDSVYLSRSFIPKNPDSSDLEFWIFDDVLDTELWNHEIYDFDDTRGGYIYYGNGYKKGDTEYVKYFTGGYPLVEYGENANYIVGIEISDSSIDIYGITVNSTPEEFAQCFAAMGYEILDATTTEGTKNGGFWIRAKRGSVTVDFCYLDGHYDYFSSADKYIEFHVMRLDEDKRSFYGQYP